MTARVPVVLVRSFYPGRKGKLGVLYACTTNGWMWRSGRAARLGPSGRRVLLAIAANSPGIVSKNDLIEILWGDDPNGGPDAAEGALGIVIQECKDAAAALGIVFENHPSRGYSARLVSSEAMT